ncbi:cyclophilin-like fold protein [Shewanella glacialipiscicola]|uniref:cyclophilin-like fold protein n=1 Tax=Shewanella glacialipiscicola TaxID=614069 RepID=UPI003D792BA8
MPMVLLLLMVGIEVASAATSASASQHNESMTMPIAKKSAVKIRIIIADTRLTATLENMQAARDFVTLLPLDLTLADYNGTERITDLPAKLSNKAAPDGYTPKVGDIAYFAPWGNLAFFYQDFGYLRGLIRLGQIDGSVDALMGDSDIKVRIEQAQNSDDSE